jgi:hypothetical protein
MVKKTITAREVIYELTEEKFEVKKKDFLSVACFWRVISPARE